MLHLMHSVFRVWRIIQENDKRMTNHENLKSICLYNRKQIDGGKRK